MKMDKTRGCACGRVAILYAVCAGAWVILSNQVLHRLVSDPRTLIYSHTYKDCVFVVVTAVVLHLATRSGSQALRETHVALKDSESYKVRLAERLEHYLAASPTVTYSLAVEAGEVRTVWVTDNILRTTGFTLEEAMQKGWWAEHLHPDDRDQAMADISRVWQDGSLVHEYRFVRKDGSTLWLRDELKILEGGDGGQEIIGAWTDITAIKEAEEKLRESEQRFRRAVQNIPDVIVLYDTDLRIRYINEAACKITGRPESDFMGKRDDEVWPPDVYQKYLPVLREALDTQSIRSIEADVMMPGTGLRSLKITCVPVIDEKGEVREILGITQDITEQRNRAKEYREMIDGMNDTAFVIDYSGRFLEVNDPAVKALGYSREELLTMSPTDIDPHLKGEDIKHLWESMPTEKRQVFETQHMTKAGDIIPVEISSSLVTYHGQPVILSVARDLSARQQAEAEAERLQAQMAQAQKMESIGRLAGGVAHDFNNMLGVIIGHADLALLRADPTSEARADLDAIKKAAQHSADLTRQLLAFARKQTIAPKVLDLNQTVASMIAMLRRIIGEDIELVWIPGPKVFPIKVDPVQIDQILANLCGNARDAIGGEGKITIETGNVVLDEGYCRNHASFVPGPYALLAVSDDGCGMDAETKASIFEPFFTTKGIGRGTGLGLAMIYGIVKQNDGFVGVYSDPGEGTTIKVYFPRAADEAETAGIPGMTEATEAGAETISLVQDEV